MHVLFFATRLALTHHDLCSLVRSGLNPFAEIITMKFTGLLLLFSSIAPTALMAQNNFATTWEDRVKATSARQPGWAVPVFAPTSGIVQLARFDALHQWTPTRTETWNFDNSKGFDFIPFARTEFDINLPPLVQHNNPKVVDGAGDFSMTMKYRPFAGSAEHHNYSTAFQMTFTVPTGSYKNGTAVSTINPTVVGGKGYKKFDIQSSIGAILPTSSVPTIGRTIQWNTVAQYQVGKYFWPEVEVNASYYHLGANDGKNQTFVTPGFMISKIKLTHDPKSRLALVLGSGMQIATSTYHAYNHGLVLTSRVVF